MIEHEAERDLAEAVVAAAEKFLRQMDELENPRPAGSWFALKDAIKAYRQAAPCDCGSWEHAPWRCPEEVLGAER